MYISWFEIRSVKLDLSSTVPDSFLIRKRFEWLINDFRGYENDHGCKLTISQ